MVKLRKSKLRPPKWTELNTVRVHTKVINQCYQGSKSQQVVRIIMEYSL